MLSGDAPTIGAAKDIFANPLCSSLTALLLATTFARKRLINQHHIETGTSGCAGRRHRSEATGGGLHTPRWRFARGSSKPRTPPSSPETGTSGCAGRRHRSEATGGGLHTPRWRFKRGSSFQETVKEKDEGELHRPNPRRHRGHAPDVGAPTQPHQLKQVEHRLDLRRQHTHHHDARVR